MSQQEPGGREPEPFAWTVSRDGVVFVTRGGRHVRTIGGAAAARLLGRLGGADPAVAQIELAKATGNYRRGNERR